MAAYSTPNDVKDELLRNVSKESDHQEAEREINRELKKRDINPDDVDEESLKELSVNYACARRCLYEMRNSEDTYAAKREVYVQAYRDGLSKVDEQMAKGELDDHTGGWKRRPGILLQRG